jgi:hypothetical protein
MVSLDGISMLTKTHFSCEKDEQNGAKDDFHRAHNFRKFLYFFSLNILAKNILLLQGGYSGKVDHLKLSAQL